MTQIVEVCTQMFRVLSQIVLSIFDFAGNKHNGNKRTQSKLTYIYIYTIKQRTHRR